MALVVTPTNTQAIHTCETITGITGPTAALVSDFFKEGANCIGFTAKAVGENLMYATGTWNLTGKTIRLWYMTANLKEIDSYVNGGFGIYLYDGTNSAYYYQGGYDNYAGGWVNLCVDPSRTPDGGTAPTLSTITRVGAFQRNTVLAKNQQGTWVDMIHACDGLTAVDTVNSYTLDDIYTKDVTPVGGGWGVLRKIGGVYFCCGSLICDNLQDASNTLIFENRKVNTGLYILRDSANMQFGSQAGAAGVSGLIVKTESNSQTPKFAIDTSITTGNTYKLYGSTFSDFNTFTPPINASGRIMLNSNFTAFGNIIFGDAVFTNCNFISYESAQSLGTSNLNNCSFISGLALVTYQGGYLLNCNFIATATTVALSWNQNINTNSKLDGTLFSSSGTGHAIEFGSSVPSELTFTDITFTGYGSDATTNAAIYNNSGKLLTIYVSGGTTPTILNGSGASTTLIVSPVSVEINVNDITTGSDLENVRVLVYVSSGGSLPYNVTVTITGSGTTATVIHSGHGLITGNKIMILGANESEYNGIHSVTYISVDSYSYTMSGTPASPATGTITATLVLIDGYTDVNGYISVSRSLSTSQPIIGKARLASGGNLYKTAPISGTISNTSGFVTTIQLIPDI
jgi:hypothetical protein